MNRKYKFRLLTVTLFAFLFAIGCSESKKKPCDKNSVLACLYASGLNALRGSVPVSVDVDGDGVVDGTLLSSKNDGILDVIDLNNDGVGDVRFIDSTGEGKGNIDGLDIDNDGFIDIYKTVSGNTTTLSTKKGGTGTTVSFLDTNADGKKDGFDLTKDSVSDTFFTLKGIDLNGDGKADAGLLDSNGDGVIDSIDLDGDLVADVSYIDTNADGVADAFDLNGDGTADIFYNSGKTPLLSTVKDGGGRTVLAVDKNRDGKYEGFDLDGDGAGEYAVTAIDFNGDGIFDGTLIDTNMDGKSDSIDINGDNIGDIAFLDTDNNGIPEGLDTNLDGTVEVYFSKSATQKLSTLINGGGSAVKTIDSNGDGSPDGFDTNGDGTIDVTIHTKGVPFKAGDKIDLDADGKVDGTLVDKDSDGKVDGIDVNGDGRRDIVYSDANGDGKYDSLDSDGDGVIDVSHKPGQAPVLSNVKNGGSATSDGDKRVVTSSVTASIVGFSTIDDQSYSVVAPVAISSNDAAPQGLKYDPSGLSLVKGTAMTGVTPTVTSGTVSSYSVSPTLPSGVSLNTTTGAISGTPSAVQQAANYTVTASNTGGTTTSVVSIGVDSTETPTGFSYSSSSVDATVGTAITPLLPTIAGTIDYCIVSPKLPAGLKLNRTTCEISGTPTTAQNTTSYTVTAKGPGGDLTTTVSIKVNSVPLVQTGTGTSTGTGTGSGTSTGTAVSAPTSVTYTGSPFTYTKGTAITTITPTLAPSGVTLTSCTISPILPAGLSINATTCAISGTPTVTSTAANYIVTATNSAGNVTTTINITVNDVAPTSITYTGSPYTYINGTAITTLTPTIAPAGVAVTSCTISPALPAGLSISPTTCAISGTPTVESVATTYTVAVGTTTTSISIKVRAAGSIFGATQQTRTTANGMKMVEFNSKLYIIFDQFVPNAAGFPFNTRVAEWDGMDVIKYVDNGTGLRKRTSTDGGDHSVSLAVFNSKLYASWREQNASLKTQIRVAEWDGATTWKFVDGDGADGINKDVTKSAIRPVLIVFNSKLYTVWTEDNKIRVSEWNGTSTWTLVEGDATNGLGSGTQPEALVFNSKLYVTWPDTVTTKTVRVKEWNGTAWSFVDGGGIRKDATKDAKDSSLGIFNSKLYLVWSEGAVFPDPAQVRVAEWDGTTTWTFKDGNATTGINNNTANSASQSIPRLIVFEQKLYATWVEAIDTNIRYVRVKVWDGTSWTSADGGAAASAIVTGGTGGVNQHNFQFPIVYKSKLYLGWTISTLELSAFSGTNTWTNQ